MTLVSGPAPSRGWALRSLLLPLAACVPVFAACCLLAFLLRFEFDLPAHYRGSFLLLTVPALAALKLAVFAACGVHRILWAYVGLHDLFKILRFTLLSSALAATGNFLFLRVNQVPRTVLVLDAILTFLAVAGGFVALRSLREQGARGSGAHAPAEPVLVVGAGDAGDMLLRELQRSPAPGVRAVGFLDDDPSKRGRVLRGVPVLGTVQDAASLAERFGVHRALVAVPSASGPRLRAIVSRLLDAGLALKVLPPQGQLSLRNHFVPQLRDVAVEDLLRREPVVPDTAGLASLLGGRTVMVTGAAGSIGSELCRQLLGFRPKALVALDCAETPLQSLILELRSRSGEVRIVPELADVTERPRVRSAFQAQRPEVVFHAAAYKHVPILEEHPREAVRVNVGGTRVVLEEAREAGAGAFVLISSDKAVNPSSVMGSTKRIAEMLAGRQGPARTVAVRFGNVLGSNGSVIPIFKEQIARGGPVTVTHPEMRRYFMTIPEAVQLVLQAAVLGRGGEVFVLDMGEPVKIVDLASDLIRLSGLVPGEDVKIEFTGIRPGEKLFEELRLDGETVEKTAHPQIFLLRKEKRGELEEAEVGELERVCANGAARAEILPRLKRLVPDYAPE
jgi:FlaA1/EpsC-like NDP-sugar epimerase